MAGLLGISDPFGSSLLPANPAGGSSSGSFRPVAVHGNIQAVFVLLPFTATTQPGHLSAPTPALVVRRQFSGGLPPIFVMLIVALLWE
eukprot:COSAG01_NODE_22290_length_862_cov_1.419397_1_plen_88_part_00